MHQLDHVPELRNDETAVVEDGGPAGLVQRDGVVLIVVREEVDEGQGRVHHDALVHGIHDKLAGRGLDHHLALGNNGELESRQLPLVAAPFLDGPLRTARPHRLGRRVAGVEARDQDVGKEQETRAPRVVFVEPTEDAGREQFAEGGARFVEALVERLVGTRAEELDSVRDKTVDCTGAAISMAFSGGRAAARRH